MCRFIAYQGEPILVEALVSLPSHSLVRQATHAARTAKPLNADGFGLGWHGDDGDVETYHNEKPAWTDPDLPRLCERVRSGSFFAHVRAATGTEVMKSNCHPFTHGRHLFMHNGQVPGWPDVQRQVEAMLPPTLRSIQRGTTDSEVIFLLAVANGLKRDPIVSMQKTLACLMELKSAAAPTGSLRFAAALSDGETLWAFRWACDDNPPTLFYRRRMGGVTIASEPTDRGFPEWDEVPSGTCIVVKRGRPVRIVPLKVAGSPLPTQANARWRATPSSPCRSARWRPGSAPARHRADTGFPDRQPC